MALVLALLLAGGAKPERPHLDLHAFPLNSLGGIVTITAILVGPEVESYYCPDVDIEWPDGTVSGVVADCPRFEDRDQCYGPLPHDDGCEPFGYPRRWTWHAILGGDWRITVTLSKAGRPLKDGKRTVSGTVR